MLSSLALRLKALSPFQIVGLAILALAVLGSSTAVASNLITGADVKDRSLTGRDIARGTVTHSNLKDDSVTSRDIKDGTVHSADLSPGVREQLAKDGTKGEKGDTGSQGPKGDTDAVGGGAAGGFVVKDTDGTIAGPMLGYTLATTLTYYYKGRAWAANALTGALSLPLNTNYFTEADCSGAPYFYPQSTQTALRLNIPGDGSNSYVPGEIESDVHALAYMNSNGVCHPNDFATQDLAHPKLIPASDVPPVLHGPLQFVPAG